MPQQSALNLSPKISSEKEFLEIAKRRFAIGEKSQAILVCVEGRQQFPESVSLGIFLSQLYQQNTQFDQMLASILSLSEKNPNNLLVSVRKSECQIYAGEIKDAIDTLDGLLKQAEANTQLLVKLAELYLHCSQHQKAKICHEKCTELQPNNPLFLYNLSFSKLTFGKIEQAKQLIKKVIALAPQDFDAYYSQSTLAKVTLQEQNIELLTQRLKDNPNNLRAEIPLGFALAKEYEDLEEYSLSFEALDRAARFRKQGMKYQVSTDVNAMQTIAENFNQETLAKAKKSQSQTTPVFILGLPRSGTTLVEQILSAHQQVTSLGEINNLAFSIMHCVGPHQNKTELIKASTHIDFSQLAKKYSKATAGYGVKNDYLIDKTPLNFLYIGLIKLAFPKAKIIHLKRHPLDSCFAMYKTLFRMGYPFSYSLSDLGDYYLAYHQLMAHWDSLFAEQIYHLDYQLLVNDPRSQSRKLLDYCELEWQDNILDFHRSSSTSATASAAQVRQPIYRTSVERWRCYQEQLSPLKNRLQASGINCD